MNTPDKWVLLEIEYEGETYFKVLAGWYGGYLDGDSWRMNSGIEKVEEHEDYYDFIGFSGSIYRCYKSLYGMTSLMSRIYAEVADKAKILDETNFGALV